MSATLKLLCLSSSSLIVPFPFLFPFHFLFSDGDKHEPGGVGQVGEVQQEVEGGEHSHSDQVRRVIISAPVVFVELEHGPDDGGSQIHDGRQEAIGRQELGEGDGEAAGALPHTQHHHRHGEDEADAVDRHAPLERRVAVVGNGVADQDEDDAGHEGLAHLQQARCRGHVACHLSWPGLGQAHLHHVGHRRQAGEDSGDDAMVSSLVGEGLALQEIDGEDDGGGEAEEGGVAGDGDGEVVPGYRRSGLEAALLHQQHQQGAGEAEHPAEEAPVGHAGQPA